jgi:hypothetical protein
VSAKAHVSVLVLVILAALPLSGTVCAYACGPAPHSARHASAHHGDACADTARADDAVHMGDLSGHDCRSHTLIAQPAATVAFAQSGGAPSSNSIPRMMDRTSAIVTLTLRPSIGQSPPRGTPPLSSTAIILRV